MVKKDFNWKLCKIRFLYEGTGEGGGEAQVGVIGFVQPDVEFPRL